MSRAAPQCPTFYLEKNRLNFTSRAITFSDRRGRETGGEDIKIIPIFDPSKIDATRLASPRLSVFLIEIEEEAIRDFGFLGSSKRRRGARKRYLCRSSATIDRRRWTPRALTAGNVNYDSGKPRRSDFAVRETRAIQETLRLARSESRAMRRPRMPPGDAESGAVGNRDPKSPKRDVFRVRAGIIYVARGIRRVEN